MNQPRSTNSRFWGMPPDASAKLTTSSVRSFDNIRSETIQFHTPLTLIVGYNGSGKTTIIECLKYATTGQLPPHSSKGGAFVHDPKLCGEKEVLAQVKLAFKSTGGAKLVVTRSLQLIVKKASRQQKTLEGQLLMIKDGERTTISSRVAELDHMMPQYLGVSEAILDNVIFCHQEESLWPMSEPSVLKKKFDEIFEALKYTKALENITLLRKNQSSELIKLKGLEDQFKIDKDRAERAEKRSLALQDEIEKLREQSEQMSREMQVSMDGAKKMHREKNLHLGILNELDMKRGVAMDREETVETLRANLTEMHESDEWLEQERDQYEERMVQYKEQEAAFNQQYADVQRELADIRKQLSAKLAEQGHHQARKEAYERQLESRQALVKESARRHSIWGYDGDLDDDSIREFSERVAALSNDKARELEREQKATEDQLQKANAVMRDLDSRRAARIQDKVSARQLMATNDRNIVNVQSGIDAIDVDEGALSVLHAAHEELKENLAREERALESADYDKQVQAENNQLREQEAESEKLNEELVQTTQRANDRAHLEFVKKELRDRQRSLEALTSRYSDKITALVGDWQPASVERKFQTVVGQKTRAVADAQSERDAAAGELRQVEFELTTARDTRRKKMQEMKTSERNVMNSIFNDEGNPIASIDEYLPELEKLEAARDTAKSDSDNFAVMSKYFNDCLVDAEKSNKCHLCDRKFGEQRERSTAVEKLRKRIETAARGQLQAELQRYEDELKEARAARGDYDICQRLSGSEIPALETTVTASEEKRATLIAKLEEFDSAVNREEAAKRDVEAVSKTVSNITRYHTDVTNFEAEIEQLSTQQQLAGASRSPRDIQDQIAAVAEQTRTLKAKIARIISDRDRVRAQVNALRLDVKDAASKLSNADHQLEKKQSLASRLDELKDANNGQREVVQRADADLESLEPQVTQAKAEYDDIRQQGQARDKEIREENSKLLDTVNKLKLAESTITAYLDEGGPQQLVRCQRDSKNVEREISRSEEDLKQITVKANTLKEQLDDSERTKRSINDNIQFRKNLRALETLRAEIAELESKNATEDYERLEAEAQKMDMNYQKLLAERGPILGAMKAKDAELARLLQEWESDYKDAAQNFRESHVKVEATKAAIEDLKRYGSALDQAIMKYHSLKMEEINRIAGELWQSTYQGTDVDTILIRADPEHSTNKKNYQYRVCMVKQDAEMDMRGRCSAGQKVLASIIIRLALAECFGVNCGLIALDEPTTNLDRDNIRSLAESLHHIIKTRQQQSNFQLIVITHDEEFLRFMRCADFCDHYYRVSRDDKQKSIIERQNIHEVI